MNQEIVPYADWQKNLRLANGQVEVIASLEVGPRILSYRHTSGENVFKMFPEQLGQANEDAFMIRGGHRLWAAPEDELLTYHWDNEPVETRESEKEGVVLISHQKEPMRLRKELSLRLDGESSRVNISHRIFNENDEAVELATWGLSVMAPGGLEILPHPPLGEHPLDLLPRRHLVLWAYTSMADPRYTWGEKFILLRQEQRPPTKIGLSLTPGWAAYLLHDSLFIKTFALESDATYPDRGCNFETFTNEEMLEIESLGPLRTLQPGESTSHDETWNLFPLDSEVALYSEDEIQEWITPYLRESGIA
jgi:hypothetical protein